MPPAGSELPAVADVLDALRRAAGDAAPAGASGAESLPARPDRPGEELVALAVELLRSNRKQWDLEDVTRRPDADDSVVADSKRAIDALNMARHGLVERIDAVVDARIPQQPTAPPATEGPGMVLDRLSVLVIRLERTRSAPAVSDRLPVLQHQIDLLGSALEVLLADVRSGARRFEPYRHLKLYEGKSAPGPGTRHG
ncbi:MAG TPA: DUF4254 domain-containing protein [Acidimicrobiales bacterium]|jgi:hypothetical protein